MQNDRMSFQLLDHPVAHDRLAVLRSGSTPPRAFREAVHQLSQLIAMEALRGLETRQEEVQTPLAAADCRVIARPVVAVPVLRAGLGMLRGFLEVLPEALVGHIGLARNEDTHRPEQYYTRLPSDLAGSEVFVLDPMLATGHSASEAVRGVREAGAARIRFLCIIAAPEGVRQLHADHPDVPIYSASLDDGLTSSAFISPGLGDAGDRYFGTL